MNKIIYKLSILLNVITLLFLGISGFIWADNNGVWHKAEDVRGGIFGHDEQDVTGGYSFINPVSFNDNVSVNGDLKVNTITSNSPNGNVIIQLG